MESFILNAGTLNDDELFLSDEGKVFKGGYVAFVYRYSFLNSQSNALSIKKFRSYHRLNDYLKKEYPHFEYSGVSKSFT